MVINQVFLQLSATSLSIVLAHLSLTATVIRDFVVLINYLILVRFLTTIT